MYDTHKVFANVNYIRKYITPLMVEFNHVYTHDVTIFPLICKFPECDIIFAYLFVKNNQIIYASLTLPYKSMDGEFLMYTISPVIIKDTLEYLQAKDSELSIHKNIKKSHNITILPGNSGAAGDDESLALFLFDALWYFIYYNQNYLDSNINVQIINMFLKLNFEDNLIINENFRLGLKLNKIFLINFSNNKFQSTFDILKFRYSVHDIEFYLNRNFCSQKLLPLSKKDLKHVGDIRQRIWRELYCADVCNYLLISLRCNSFPFTIGYSIFKTSKDTYNNKNIRVRYENSENLSESIKKMKNIQRDVGVFQTFANAINDPVQLAENYILSDYSICIYMENVGFPFSNLLLDNADTAIIKKNSQTLEKCILEIFITLSALHNEGVIHSDLHMNNCTIKFKNNSPSLNCAKTILIFGADFVVPHYTLSYIANVIDFSRSLVNHSGLLKNELQDMLFEFYSYMMMTEFKNYVADPEEFETKYKIAVVENPELVFKYITAFDPFYFCHSFLSLARQLEYGNKNQLIHLLETLKDQSAKILLSCASRNDLAKFPVDTLINSNFDFFASKTPFSENQVKTRDEYRKLLPKTGYIDDVKSFPLNFFNGKVTVIKKEKDFYYSDKLLIDTVKHRKKQKKELDKFLKSIK